MKIILACVLAIGLASIASAQALPIDKLTPPAASQTGRDIADFASYAGLATQIGIDTYASWKADDRAHAFKMEGIRLSVTVASSEIIKRLVRRSRPCAPSCGVDNPNASFWSEHTALAFSTTPHGVGGVALTFSLLDSSLTGGERILANKHFLTDVLAGAGVGYATSFIR